MEGAEGRHPAGIGEQDPGRLSPAWRGHRRLARRTYLRRTYRGRCCAHCGGLRIHVRPSGGGRRLVIAGGVTRPTRTRYAVLLFVYLAAFITYLDRVCISVAAPVMQQDLGLSQIQFAWVFTAFYIAYSIFERPTAWMGD